MKTRRLQKTELSILPLSRGCGYGQCHRIESTVPPTVPQWVCSLRDQHGGLEQGNGDLCVHHLVLSGCYSSGKHGCLKARGCVCWGEGKNKECWPAGFFFTFQQKQAEILILLLLKFIFQERHKQYLLQVLITDRSTITPKFIVQNQGVHRAS